MPAISSDFYQTRFEIRITIPCRWGIKSVDMFNVSMMFISYSSDVLSKARNRGTDNTRRSILDLQNVL